MVDRVNQRPKLQSSVSTLSNLRFLATNSSRLATILGSSARYAAHRALPLTVPSPSFSIKNGCMVFATAFTNFKSINEGTLSIIRFKSDSKHQLLHFCGMRWKSTLYATWKYPRTCAITSNSVSYSSEGFSFPRSSAVNPL